MKKILLICFCIIANFIQAQNTEQAIRELEQMVVKAILHSDTTILKELWDPDFIVNTPRNNIAENREAVFQNQRDGLINYSSFERIIENMEIRENIVITMGYETLIPKNDLQTIKRRFTNVWLNKNGKWVQIARQASIICQ